MMGVWFPALPILRVPRSWKEGSSSILAGGVAGLRTRGGWRRCRRQGTGVRRQRKASMLNAGGMRCLFVAARLPAPTGAGSAATSSPSERGGVPLQNARRRCIRTFRSGAASRAGRGGTRSPPHPPSERGGVPLQNARRQRIRLFVAARLPAPTEVGPAAHRTPPRNAEAFRYKMRGGSAFASL